MIDSERASPRDLASAAVSQTAPAAHWLADVRASVTRAGVPAETFDRLAHGLEPDPEVIALAMAQPEHVKSTGDYLAAAVGEERIREGRRQLAERAGILAAIEAAYGVDRHVLVAIWGIESSFGTRMGERQVIRSLATLAALEPRRRTFWQGEMVAALRIAGSGRVPPERMTGSWAGAGGHTQFMPTTYLAHAVDFDGDGRADIWGSPADALASAASYLAAAGWRAGEPWGFEIILPRHVDVALSAPGRARPVGFWRAQRVTLPGGRPLPATSLPLQLLLPAGSAGPAFLVSGNFAALLKYNPAVSYALAAGHLADRLAGGEPLAGSWPAGGPLVRQQREELQRLLAGRGLDTGGIDGIIGARSQAAIRAFQRRRGLPEDGYASPELLELLRTDPGALTSN